jgi:serine-type D-Ala-D-Ala carboxypeptidase/endopeptidase (penicillin-binding protein 4)
MKKSTVLILTLLALPAWAGAAKPGKRHGSHKVRAAGKVVTTAKKPACKTPEAKPAPVVAWSNEAPKPDADDPDRERILRLQESIEEIVRGKVLGRLRVGLQVEALATGRQLFGWRRSILMDPASNQKVLATTAALLRLGNSFRYRTEVTGPGRDSDGTILGDIVIRGSGDPSLRARHVEGLAESLAANGVTRVTGSVLGDPRRIGSDESAIGGRPPLRVGSTAIEVHVRPGDRVGSRPVVSLRPASDAFVVVNQAETQSKGKGRLGVSLGRAGNRIQVIVTGKISQNRGPVVIHRSAPSHPLFAAILLRQALIQAGIVVHGNAGIWSGDRSNVAREPAMDGIALALGSPASDSPGPLFHRDSAASSELLALHESEPLPVLLRRINKDSDNEWAERLLETVGAEVYGGAPTTAKGVRALREALADLGLPVSAYLPSNGSGLGHQNRVSASGMIALLRHLYFDLRIGPELMQSLSVGGVDGTTRNRFRGSSAAHRVRAKTGTLNGVSCLSGFVGDGSEILAFSILVEGHRRRSVPAIRAAQVSAVNAMMRFAKRASGPLPGEESTPGSDFETGDEADEEDEAAEKSDQAAPPGRS